MTHKRFFVLNVIVLLAIIFPLYVAQAADSMTLINETYNVPLRSIRYLRIYIDTSGKGGNIVSGSVKTDGKDLNFYVFDHDGFDRWVEFEARAHAQGSMGPFGGPYGTKKDYFVKEFSVYVFAEGGSSYEYSFVPSQTDYYYFVFDNYWNVDWQTNKTVQVTVIWTYQNIPTSISCSVSLSEVTEGNPVTVSGSTSPVSSGLTITLTYRKPDSTTVTRTVTTGSDGSYSDTYLPDAAGSWSVKASWDGDSTHAAVSGSSVTFTVKSKSFFETSGGIISIFSIVIVAVAMVALTIRRRRSEWG